MKQLNNLTILGIFLTWRILLFLPLILSEKLLLPRPGFDYTSPFHFLTTNNVASNFLLYPWGNFDGIYYLYIAKAGYTIDNSGFFPLYPLLIKIFSVGESSIQFYVALILSSVFFFLSLIMFYKLIKLDYENNTAISAILAILVFPTSFFFASIYSESFFLFLLVSSFYFARKKKWILSSLFGVLLTATRIVGIAILPALLFELYMQEKTFLSKKIIPILLTPLGLAAYSLFNFVNFGNAFQFITAQGTLLNNRSVDQIILFPQTVLRYLKILTTISPSIYEWWVALLELSSFSFAAVLLYTAWKKKVRASYILFALIAFAIPVSSGTFSALPRYILVLFPMFIVLALIKNKWIKLSYFVLAPILLFVLFMLFSKGYFTA